MPNQSTFLKQLRSAGLSYIYWLLKYFGAIAIVGIPYSIADKITNNKRVLFIVGALSVGVLIYVARLVGRFERRLSEIASGDSDGSSASHASSHQHGTERRQAKRVANAESQRARVSPSEAESPQNRERRLRLRDARTILGLDKTAGAPEIRRRFHRLALQYHPDKVAHLGAEAQRLAHDHFIQIKRAYETLSSEEDSIAG